MKIKLIEVRDEGTLIPMLCIDMNPGEPYPHTGSISEDEFRASRDAYSSRMRLLRRSGYPCDGKPNIAITHLSADGDRFSNDPYYWGGRTRPVAHDYIIKNWATLKDGDVVDVQFILGETKAPKVSEAQQ